MNIVIEESDLPITVVEKLITATKPESDLVIRTVKEKLGVEGKEDMFTVDELLEIADYLQVYCKHCLELEGKE